MPPNEETQLKTLVEKILNEARLSEDERMKVARALILLDRVMLDFQYSP